MLNFSLCPICNKTLWDYGCVAASIFEDICISIIKDKEHFDIPDEETGQYILLNANRIYTIIKFLENKGYIITTEIDQTHLRIKPLGIRCSEDHYGISCHFCLKGDEHV